MSEKSANRTLAGPTQPGVQEALRRSFRDDRAAVLATVARRVRDLHLAEDAVQEAFASAAQHWPNRGIPDRPVAWLVTAAWRKALDTCERQARTVPHAAPELSAPSSWPITTGDRSHPGRDEPTAAPDDLLALVLTCAHPALDAAAQIALTLRHVAGLTDAQTADRMLVTPVAMTKRLVRARAKIKASGVSFDLPAAADLPARLDVARTVTYLQFTQGYSSANLDQHTAAAQRADAIWLGRQLHRLTPGDHETTGLLALMLLHESRAAARTDHRGELIPFTHQQRGRYDTAAIAQARQLLAETAAADGELGSYQIQAAIAAVQTAPERAEDIDYELLVDLYNILARLDPSPVVEINRATAMSRAHSPAAALEVLTPLLADPRLATSAALHAAHAHILTDLGDTAAADQAFTEAARLAPSPRQRQHIEQRQAGRH